MKILYVAGLTRMVLFNKLVSRTLSKIGYEVIEFDWNSVFKFNKTFRIFSDEKIWKRVNKLLLKKAKFAQPDFAFVLKGEPVYPETLLQLKEITNAKLFNWFGDDPWEFPVFSGKMAKYYDFFFTYDPYSVKLYKGAGYNNAYHLPYGYDAEITSNLNLTKKDYKKYGCDISFIGSHYPKREELLSKIKDKYNLKIWGRGWKGTSCEDVYQGRALYGTEMLKAMKASKILLNIHKGFGEGVEASGEGLNLRVMEGAACGAFQISNHQADIPNRFIPNEEIVLFDDWKKAVEKIDFYLREENKRKEIAEAGYKRFLFEHTLDKRLKEMMKIISDSSENLE